jgi:hypothetical protein
LPLRGAAQLVREDCGDPAPFGLGVERRLAQQRDQLREVAIVGEVAQIRVTSTGKPRVQLLAIRANTPLEDQLEVERDLTVREHLAQLSRPTLVLAHGTVPELTAP